MAKLIVAYPMHDGAKFDRDYYTATHIPLVETHWGPAGMTGAEIMWPADGGQPFACMVALAFADDAAVDAALASPGTPEVLGDVANFTDIQPTVYRTA
ncbi:MAG: EthD family reductase [Sphingomonadales bacterium]|nr:EthD family reductase [Sphingomonadales bacterium]MBD3772645.1 EthD family reductase [Paracoccaceae bacterium]